MNFLLIISNPWQKSDGEGLIGIESDVSSQDFIAELVIDQTIRDHQAKPIRNLITMIEMH